MKPILAAFFVAFSLSPAFAQDAGTPPSSPDGFGGTDRGAWKAAFDAVEQGYGALPAEKKKGLEAFLNAQDHPNAACAAPKGGTPQECGAVVDHFLLVAKKISKQPSGSDSSVLAWRDSEGQTLFNSAAKPIYDELRRMQKERSPEHVAAQKAAEAQVRAQAAEQEAAAKKTQAMIHNFSGDGGIRADPAPQPQAPTLYQSAANVYHSASAAVRQTVSDLTPVSSYVGDLCNGKGDAAARKSCYCQVYSDLRCSANNNAERIACTTAMNECGASDVR
ncbi:MAG: hypothetical protein ACHQ49_01015 [Elusimicrobiota bacterium]